MTPTPQRPPLTDIVRQCWATMTPKEICARYGYQRTADPYTLGRTATTHRVRFEALHSRRHHLTFIDL